MPQAEHGKASAWADRNNQKSRIRNNHMDREESYLLNISNIKYSRWRLLETARWFLLYILNVRREATMDNTIAPAMAPNIMPANAPLLKADLEGRGPSVTF